MSDSKVTENKTVQKEKPSSKNKIAVIALGLVILVVIIAGVATQIPKSNTLTVTVSPTKATINGQNQTLVSSPYKGTPPYFYQWFENDTLISGATSKNLTFVPSGEGIYLIKVRVTDSASVVVNSSSSILTVPPYVEVDYKTIGWFHDFFNNTYLVLNITMTNKGYSKGVLCHWDIFNATISGVSYSQASSENLYNSSGAQMRFTDLNLPGVTLQNGGSVSGQIAFEIPITLNPYVLGCSTYFSDFSSPNPQVKIFQK